MPPGRSHRRSAQALVEAAIVYPLVVLLSLAVVQFVLYEHARDVLSSAAQEGARLAAEDGRNLDDGYLRVRALVQAGLGSAAEPLDVDLVARPDVVEIALDTRLRAILPLPLGDELPIHVQATVVRERFRPGGVDQ